MRQGVILGICFSAIFVVHALIRYRIESVMPPGMTDDKQARYHLAVESRHLKKAVFGYEMMGADLIWLRFLQGMDAPVVDRQQRGWLYNLLDGCVSLDPRFRLAFGAGGTWLSVIRRDLEGATDILERAYLQFPEDWSIHAKLIYHHIYETQNFGRASEVARHATGIPNAPDYSWRLASTLAAKTLDFASGIGFLERLASQTEDEQLKAAYIVRRDELIVLRDTKYLTDILNKNFKDKWPNSWSAAIEKKLIRGIPAGPDGTAYVLNAAERKISSPTIMPRKTGFDSKLNGQ